MVVKVLENEKGNPAGKLADVELHFTAGPLRGLKLIGFAVWERRSGSGRNVTFPSRQYSVNGERRSFGLLRPSDVTTGGAPDLAAHDRLRDLVLAAYAGFEKDSQVARAVPDDAVDWQEHNQQELEKLGTVMKALRGDRAD